jgi:MGT family glycosyltransferase
MDPRPERPLDVLFTTWSGGGNLPPVLTVAGKLAARGHAVRIMSEACDRADVESSGARFVAWTRAPSRPDRSRDTDFLRDWEATNPAEGFGRLLDAVIAGPALAYAQDLREELARRPADLVVTCEMLMGVLAACEAMGQPAAVLAPNICVFPEPGAPSVTGGLGPARTPAERQALAEAHAGMTQLLDGGLPALNAARAALGLRPLAHLADQLQAARGHLLATSPAFDFPWDDRPDAYAYVGPQISDPAGLAWTSPWPPQDARPLVLVSFSTTFQDQTATLQRVLDGLSGLPVRALLTTGDTIDPAELRAPANAVVLRKAPHVAVMREAALVITHGGHGTVIRAVSAGLPSLIVPHGRDQADNARRVTERGAGLELGADAAAEAFAGAARRLLEEPGFRAAAERLGAAVRRDTEASPVVEVLESLVRTREPVPA